MAVIEEELQASIGDVFSELSAEPVAAASLGQVCRLFLFNDYLFIFLERPLNKHHSEVSKTRCQNIPHCCTLSNEGPSI